MTHLSTARETINQLQRQLAEAREEIARQVRVGDPIVSRKDLADMMDAKDSAEAALTSAREAVTHLDIDCSRAMERADTAEAALERLVGAVKEGIRGDGVLIQRAGRVYRTNEFGRKELILSIEIPQSSLAKIVAALPATDIEEG